MPKDNEKEASSQETTAEAVEDGGNVESQPSADPSKATDNASDAPSGQESAQQNEAETRQQNEGESRQQNETAGCRQSEVEEYFALTPVDHVECIDAYVGAFDFALDRKDIRNIAVTGPYGSGKSSVVRSYFNDRAWRAAGLKTNERGESVPSDVLPNDCYVKPLYVSLSKFEKYGAGEGEGPRGGEQPRNSETPADPADPEMLSARLEAEIINQIVQRVDPKKTRGSRFSRKEDGRKVGLVPFCVSLILTIAAIVYLLNIGSFWMVSELTEAERASIMPTYQASELIAFAVLILAGFYLVYCVSVKLLRNSALSGISLAKYFDVQFKSPDHSPENISRRYLGFNEYMNEALYLIRNSGYKVIVFEDIDRFSNVEIFTSLRTMNFILNNQLDDESKKPIKFIYLLGDDLLGPGAKTKFFDFAIPIVPFVTSQNSSVIYMNRLRQIMGDDEYKASNIERVLRNLALYVDDPRVLVASLDDFMVYRKALGIQPEMYEGLLALCVYKGLFPFDYERLIKGEGILYYALGGVKTELIAAYKSLEKELRERVEAYEDPHSDYVGEGYGVDSLNYNERLRKTCDSMRDWIAPNPSKRSLTVFELIAGRLPWSSNKEITHQIQAAFKDGIRRQMDDVRNKTGHDENHDEKQVEFIWVAISKRYINESYKDYITYLHGDEGILSEADATFVRNVHANLPNSASQKLDKPSLVNIYLDAEECMKPECLNASLIEELLLSEVSTPEDKDRANKMLGACLNRTPMINRKFFEICAVCPDIFEHSPLIRRGYPSATRERTFKKLVNRVGVPVYRDRNRKLLEGYNMHFALFLLGWLKRNNEDKGGTLPLSNSEKLIEKLNDLLRQNEANITTKGFPAFDEELEALENTEESSDERETEEDVSDEGLEDSATAKRIEKIVELLETADYKISNLNNIEDEDLRKAIEEAGLYVKPEPPAPDTPATPLAPAAPGNPVTPSSPPAPANPS